MNEIITNPNYQPCPYSEPNSEVKNTVATATAIMRLWYPELAEDYVPQFLRGDSVCCGDHFDKTICRLLEFLRHSQSPTTAFSFRASNLVEIIKYIDTYTVRDYLYEHRLNQDCSLLIPVEIPHDAPWEGILRPIKTFQLNRQVIHNPFIAFGLALYLLQMVRAKTGIVHNLADLSPIMIVLQNDLLLGQIEATFVRAVQLIGVRHNLTTPQIAANSNNSIELPLDAQKDDEII